MKKRFIYRKWLVNILVGIIVGWVGFVAMTIDSLGNNTYDKILFGWTVLTIISFVLLKNHSHVFDEEF